MRCMQLHMHAQAHMQVSLHVQFIAHAKSYYFQLWFGYYYTFLKRNFLLSGFSLKIL